MLFMVNSGSTVKITCLFSSEIIIGKLGNSHLYIRFIFFHIYNYLRSGV